MMLAFYFKVLGQE